MYFLVTEMTTFNLAYAINQGAACEDNMVSQPLVFFKSWMKGRTDWLLQLCFCFISLVHVPDSSAHIRWFYDYVQSESCSDSSAEGHTLGCRTDVED